MFVQVIQGEVADRAGIRAALDRWHRELAPGAVGWLGSTAGVTPDGRFITLARFESPEAAQRNSQRPDQDEWWRETARLFTSEVIFLDSTQVVTYLGGGSDAAGFVQVMQGRSSDPARLLEFSGGFEAEMKEYRPDILGGVVALHDGGRFTEAVYFSDEAAAREGERRPLPPQMQEVMQEQERLISDMRYLDLPEPWLYRPTG